MGLLLPAAELDASTPQRTFLAVSTAFNALNRVALTELQLPRLIGLACPETDPESLTYLLDQLQARLILGPTRADLVPSVRSQIGRSALLFAPFADAPSLESDSPSTDDASLVSCKPNRSEEKLATLSGIRFVRSELQDSNRISVTATTLLAFSNLEAQLGFASSFSVAQLAAAAVQTVTYDDTQNGEDLANYVASERTPQDLVAAGSPEANWGENITAIDRAVDQPPYYLLSDKQASVLDLVAHDLGPQPRQYERVFGLDSPLDRTLHEQFANDFRSVGSAMPGGALVSVDATVSPGLDRVHDCAYLAAYAAIAAQLRFSVAPRDLSAEAVLVGLRAFIEGGVALSVGSADITAVLDALDATRGGEATVNLSGGYGELDLQGLPSVDQILRSPTALYVRPRASTLELYCVDAARTQFCDTGLLFSTSDGKQFGAGGGCPCFPNP